MDNMGIITLLPPLFIIVFALVTRKTLEALILGGLIGCVIAYGKGFFSGYCDFFYATASDTGNIWVILVCGLFGSFIEIMRKANATSGFTKLVLKYSNSEKKSMMIAWVLGIIIFVDEYLNVLTIGNAMRSVCDEQKTPREMLAYVIDSTGVPVCMLIPISTQAVYWASMLAKEHTLEYLGGGMQIFIKTIPFSFYAMAATIIVPLVILKIIPTFGPMKKAYKRSFKLSLPTEFEERIAFLADLGFATEETVRAAGQDVNPLRTLVSIVNKYLENYDGSNDGELNDCDVLRVEFTGTKDGVEKEIDVECVIRTSEKWGFMAGALDTGVPPSIVAQMICDGRITEKVSMPL